MNASARIESLRDALEPTDDALYRFWPKALKAGEPLTKDTLLSPTNLAPVEGTPYYTYQYFGFEGRQEVR